jgi:hypothetical protein
LLLGERLILVVALQVNRLAKTGKDRDQFHSFAQSISV